MSNEKKGPYAPMQDHIQRYRETNGVDGHEFGGCYCLLLDTIGRKSGETRTVAVVYGQSGDDFIIIGSKGGSPTPPQWYLNLMASPSVNIQVKDKHYSVEARLASDTERPALWSIMTEAFADFNDYEKKLGRQLPVIVLSRAEQ